MSEPVVQVPEDPDTAMEGAEPSTPQITRAGNGDNFEGPTAVAGEEGADPMEEEEGESVPQPNPGQKFIDYLKSPIVELVVGEGEETSVLSAHQALLASCPFFEEKLAESNRRIELPDENLDAIGAFLQYQYTGEYFPRRLPGQDGLEKDPTAPKVDDDGEQLLKHARVYTLAEKLGLPELKALAHSKIHRIDSSARGEIAYARYVYANTSPDDSTIRRPVAAFWATRSHVLRRSAEEDFKAICLEHPTFSFDILSIMLDQKEKRAQDRAEAESSGLRASGRKRPRADR
ncbi:hypothetical protein FQN54_000940 [Arachnomyces sp. PD_36]|nr:hypothetical protein FQN54_000940 [Arachnomyces sp. PD_36]